MTALFEFIKEKAEFVVFLVQKSQTHPAPACEIKNVYFLRRETI
jgi:hypothetical protein